MKVCVLYFSQTGNTKTFAEAIGGSLETDAVFDLTKTKPTVVNDYDLMIFGTPVHGFSPSEEALPYVERLPQGDGKLAALFCTCRL